MTSKVFNKLLKYGTKVVVSSKYVLKSVAKCFKNKAYYSVNEYVEDPEPLVVWTK